MRFSDSCCFRSCPHPLLFSHPDSAACRQNEGTNQPSATGTLRDSWPNSRCSTIRLLSSQKSRTPPGLWGRSACDRLEALAVNSVFRGPDRTFHAGGTRRIGEPLPPTASACRFGVHPFPTISSGTRKIAGTGRGGSYLISGLPTLITTAPWPGTSKLYPTLLARRSRRIQRSRTGCMPLIPRSSQRTTILVF